MIQRFCVSSLMLLWIQVDKKKKTQSTTRESDAKATGEFLFLLDHDNIILTCSGYPR